MPQITRIIAELLETPLHSPFVTSQGATSVARAVAITLETDAPNLCGYGESVPVQYVTGETIETVLEQVKAMTQVLVGRDLADLEAIALELMRRFPNSPSARCGVEMALTSANATSLGMTPMELWGGAKREVTSDLTLPIVENSLELAAKAWESGIRTFKLKVGGEGLVADIQRVLALSKRFPEATLRIDANQGFSVDEAVEFAERLVQERVAVQLLEQPVHADDFAGMIAVAERSPLPIFADESVKTPQDAERYRDTPIAGYNCKINKSGLLGVGMIAAIARSANKKLMIGCMLETRYSIFHSLSLACGTGFFDYIDLDSHLLLNEVGKENQYFLQTGDTMQIP